MPDSYKQYQDELLKERHAKYAMDLLKNFGNNKIILIITKSFVVQIDYFNC